MDNWHILYSMPFYLTYLPRLFIGVIIASLGVLISSLALIGVKDIRNSKSPRVKFVRKFVYFLMKLCLQWEYGYTRSTTQRVNVDYSKYLGKDYTAEWSGASTIVCNHANWIDSFFVLHKHDAVLTTAESTKHIPVIGRLMQAIGAIFISRKGDNSYSKDKSSSVLCAIKDHQNLVEDGKSCTPLLMYPEACACHHQDYLFEFKIGAFVNLSSIQPVIVKYETFMGF